MQVRPGDGVVLASYQTGKSPFSAVFDGTNVWAANFGSDSVSTSNAAAGGTTLQ